MNRFRVIIKKYIFLIKTKIFLTITRKRFASQQNFIKTYCLESFQLSVCKILFQISENYIFIYRVNLYKYTNFNKILSGDEPFLIYNDKKQEKKMPIYKFQEQTVLIMSSSVYQYPIYN